MLGPLPYCLHNVSAANALEGGTHAACAKAASNAADRARDAANDHVMRRHNTTNCALLARGDESASAACSFCFRHASHR